MSKGSFCQVTLLGNIGKTPEAKYTPQGTAVVQFSVATSRSYKDRDGNWSEATEWHNVTAWARAGEVIAEYCKKGDKIFITGDLRTDSWEDKQSGQKRYRTYIVVDQFCLIGSRSADGDHSQQESNRNDRPQESNRNVSRSNIADGEQSGIAGGPITDDDIPF
jgi:single-strand DNA-binding protein